MPLDQFGKTISQGDTVLIKGKVTTVLASADYVNCTVELMAPMPPSGAKTTVEVNTTQVEKQGGDEKKQ